MEHVMVEPQRDQEGREPLYIHGSDPAFLKKLGPIRTFLDLPDRLRLREKSQKKLNFKVLAISGWFQADRLDGFIGETFPRR
jgi:hypothetical protein